MLFVIHAPDKPDAYPRRMAHYDAHKAFLTTHEKLGVKIIISGPLVADDGITPIGSHFVIESPDRQTAENFHRADPFFVADVWSKATITAFVKRYG